MAEKLQYGHGETNERAEAPSRDGEKFVLDGAVEEREARFRPAKTTETNERAGRNRIPSYVSLILPTVHPTYITCRYVTS